MPISFPILVRWTQGDAVVDQLVRSADEAARLFERIRATTGSAPTMVEFSDERSGLALALGAGRPMTVLTYQESLDPPYFTSKATNARAAEDIEFEYAGENTPYPSESAVPIEAGLVALRLFLETGDLPDNIDWERL